MIQYLMAKKEFTIQVKAKNNLIGSGIIARPVVLSFTFHETQRPKSGNSSNYATVKSGFESLDNQVSILKTFLDTVVKNSFNYGAFLKFLNGGLLENLQFNRARIRSRFGTTQKVPSKKRYKRVW